MRAKLFSVLMLAMLVLVLAACGKQETASTNDEDASTATESASSTDSATPSESEPPSDSASGSDSATPEEASPTPEAEDTESQRPAEEPEASTDDDDGDAKDDDSKSEENPPPENTGSEEPSNPPPPPSEPDKQNITVQVEIKDFAFSPAEIEIVPGTKVEFINRDSVEHTATADDATFDTGLLEQDKSQIVTLDKEGTFTYYCAPHPAMTGKIVVKAK